MVSKDFKSFADEVVPAESKFNIDCIQVNDNVLFTEFESTLNENTITVRITANIGKDNRTVYYNGTKLYDLQFCIVDLSC